jgi:hypothetical protein
MLQFSGSSISLDIKNLEFSKQKPAQNRAPRPKEIQPYAVFGAILYTHTEFKKTRIAQSA